MILLASSGRIFTDFRFIFPILDIILKVKDLYTFDYRHIELVFIESKEVSVQVDFQTIIYFVCEHFQY